MAISLSPKPSDGPLNGQASAVQITVTVSGPIGRVGGIIKIPGRTAIEVAPRLLLAGRNRVVIPLPPGGVPPASQLRLKVVDGSGAKSVAIYTFR